MKKILFYYPSRSIGGAQILFVRLANYFSKIKTYKVFIVDYEDGYLKKNVSHNVEVIEYDKRQEVTLENMIVISPLSMILSIYDNLPLVKGKFLFWGIHPENTIDILKGTHQLKKYFKNVDLITKCINFIQYKRIKDRLLKGLVNNTVVFMDEANKDRTFEFYHIESKYETYLPIPIIEQNGVVDYSNRKKNRIAWIGRLSPDKIYSLLFILEKFNKINIPDLEIHIVGDGSHMHLLNRQNYSNIKIHMHGFVANDNLLKTLTENYIGMVVGMGTSVLESSMMQLPSLLIDPSYVELKKTYRPKWLFETSGYTLGSFNHKIANKNVEELIYDYLDDEINYIGLQCFDYAKSNHLLPEVAKKMEKYFE